MKKAIFTLMALGFVLTNNTFAEEKKKKEPSAAWKALPQEAKRQNKKDINKKIKDGELTEEEGKSKKQAIWKANKKK